MEEQDSKETKLLYKLVNALECYAYNLEQAEFYKRRTDGMGWDYEDIWQTHKNAAVIDRELIDKLKAELNEVLEKEVQ